MNAGDNKNKVHLRDVIEFLLLPILTAGVYTLWDLNKNVGSLNVQVGILIANNSAIERRIDDLKERVQKLEDIQRKH